MTARCVDCGHRCRGRRCKACGIERKHDYLHDEPEPGRAVEVRCACGYRAEWDPEHNPHDTHHHDDLCEQPTRYQAVGDGGARYPTRAPHQRVHGGRDRRTATDGGRVDRAQVDPLALVALGVVMAVLLGIAIAVSSGWGL